MKNLVRLMMIGASWCAISATASAQNYKTPVYNGCIRQFYDSRMYNWFSLENTCGEKVRVVFVPNNPGYGGGAMDLGPGRHDSTGDTADEVRQKRGYELYVCPAGYLPVDENGRYVSRVIPNFRCKEE